MAKLQGGTIVYGTANVLANLVSGSVSILGSGNGIIFVDGTYQTTNAASYNYSTQSYLQANNAASFANGAFTLANTITGVDNTQNTNISSAQSYANSAFDQANSAASFANGAFTLANNITGVNDTQNTNISSAQSYANSAFTTANNAQATAQGAYNMANNSVITLTSNSQSQITTNNTLGNIIFGLATTGVVAGSYAYYTNWQVDAFGRMTTTTASSILEPMANAAYDFANTGYSKANSAASFANGAFARANSGYDQANSAASFANGAFTAANVAYGLIQITANTGDLLANGVNTPVTGNILLGLATTSVAAGTYGGASSIPVVTFDDRGRATYAANVAISIPAGTSIQANTNGALFANGTQGVSQTGTVLLSLANTAVTSGTYGGSTQIPVYTVDGSGRITYAANVAFSGGATIVDDTATNATRYPLFADATSGTLSTVYTGSTDLTFNPSTGTFSAVIFSSLSDENQKTNIKPIQNALNIVENIKGVTFDWKESNVPSAGLIAQDVEKYLPQLIENVDDKKTLNYNGVIGILVEAIKELNEKVKQLENKE